MRFAITSEGHCLGFVLSRGPKGWSAFDADEQPLGTFETEDGAVTAITQKTTVSNKST
jgi:hypothetical protein